MIQEFAAKVLRKAADMKLECEVYAVSGDSVSLCALEGALDEYEVSTSQGAGVRVLHEGSAGMSFTEDLTVEPELLLRWARDNAAAAQEPAQPLFAGSESYPELTVDTTAVRGYDTRDKIRDVLALEALCKADGAVKSVQHCQLTTSLTRTVVANTAGLSLARENAYLATYCMPLVHDGADVQEGFAFVVGRDPLQVDWQDLAARAVAVGRSRVGAAPCKGYKGPVAFDPEAFADLMSAFTGVFSAENAQKGLSLLAGKEGQSIAVAGLDLIDAPLLPDSQASRAFDAEGVATYTKPIIADGVLTTLLHNRKTAAAQGVQTTANAARGGYSGGIGISPSNFYIQPSDTPRASVLAGLHEGLLVTDVSGLHAGCNAVSGDFSVQVKGFWCRDGAPCDPVCRVTVSGNFFELLCRIMAWGDDLTFAYPGGARLGAPTMLVDELTVSGK